MSEQEQTREHWRTRAYEAQARISRYKTGPMLARRIQNTSPPPEPVDSGRGTAQDWEKLCGLLARYATAYTGGRPPSDKLINDLTKLRAKVWD